jgi:hypothetical protein
MEKDWKTLYELLGEARPPLRLRVLDTVVFDSLALHKPLFKVFTEAEQVYCHNLRGTSVDGVVQDVLATSAAVVTVRSALKLNAAVREKLALCSKGSTRYLLDLPGLASLAVAHANGFDGLTLLRKPGCFFSPQVYVHEAGSIRVRGLHGEEYSQSCNAEVEALIHQASATLGEKIEEVSRQIVLQLVTCYRFDETHKQVWLLGIDRCILEKPKRLDPLNERTMSVVQLNKTFSGLNAQPDRRWLRPAPPRLGLTPSKQRPKRQGSRFRGWAQVRDMGSQHVVHLVDSSFLQRSQTLSEFKPFLDYAPHRTPYRQALRPNLSAFSGAAFRRKTEPPPKPVLMGQDSDLERSLREAHSGAACGSLCAGDFCSMDVSGFQQPSNFDVDARFLVLKNLLLAARTPVFSPHNNPALKQVRALRLVGKPFKEVNTPFDVAKLVTKNEPVQLSVCLKCFLIYYNVQEAVLAKLISTEG